MRARFDRRDLARLIAGDAATWTVLAPGDPGVLCRDAEAHGILPLLAAAAVEQPAAPAGIVAALRRRASAEAVRDLVREVDLRQLVDALDRAGVAALLIKGADVAYSQYPRPDLRPRLDTDLLIKPGAHARAVGVLEQLGYEALEQVEADLVMYQQSFVRRDATGARAHLVDLHWRIANPQRFAHVLQFDELAASATPRPALGPHAWGLDPAHGLVLACVHRVAHHFDPTRLIWTYDLHRLATALEATDWTRVTALARDRRVAAICLRGLADATAVFGTPVPETAENDLRAGAAAEGGHDAYLGAGSRHIRRILSDLQYLPTWEARWRLTRQHVFPPARYMREVYAPESATPLAILYARRAWRGARRWFAKS